MLAPVSRARTIVSAECYGIDENTQQYHVTSLGKPPRAQRDTVVSNLRKLEKQNFPTHEAMDFDAVF
jgi:hypothetical protein